MKHIIINLLIFLFLSSIGLSSCSKMFESETEKEAKAKPDANEMMTPDKKLSDEQESEFPGARHIRDGLYEDEDGNLFLKPVTMNEEDVSLVEGVFKRGQGKVDKVNLADIIDKDTFINVGGSYYKDKDNVYHYNKFGQYNIVKDALPSDFEVFNTSIYAKDAGSVYYNGEKIKGADSDSFETIEYTIDDRNIGFFAKDNNNYYKGWSVMREDEIKIYGLDK